MSKGQQPRRNAARGAATAQTAPAEVTVNIQQLRSKEQIFNGGGELDCNFSLTVPEFCEEYGVSKIRVMEFEDEDTGDLVWKVKGAKIYCGPSCFEEFETIDDLKAALKEVPEDFVIAWFDPQWEGHNDEVIRLVYLG